MNKKMTKQELREGRIRAMQILYFYDMTDSTDHNLDDVLEVEISGFTDKLVEGVIVNILDIDAIITKNLTNYTIDRLSFVDRAIIRIATYEILQKTPASIVINEALEIVKEYSDQGDGKNKRFIHRVIDQINKSINQ